MKGTMILPEGQILHKDDWIKKLDKLIFYSQDQGPHG